MKKSVTPTPKDLGLSSDSFVGGFDDEGPSRVIANIEGPQKTGKDFFAFTAPDPIVVFNFDCGLEGVVERFIRKGKKIIVAGVPKSGLKYPSYRFARPVPDKSEKLGRKDFGYLNRVKKLAGPIWERFINDLTEFYESEARTGIIDTGGAAFGLAKFAFHGMDKGRPDPKADPYGQKSGDMKTIFQGLVTDGYSYDKNMLWLHRVKEQWSGNQPTGKYIADGYNQIAFEVMMTLRTFKTTKRKATTYGVKVMDLRGSLDDQMEGEQFDGAQCDFATVMAVLFGTTEEEWQ